MVIETIVFSSVIGYMGGAIIGKGLSTSEVNGVKVVKIDFNKGYKDCMADKKFRFIRDMALVSGTAYVYAKGEQKRTEKRVNERKEREKLYREMKEEYNKNMDDFIDNRYDDYHAIAQFILDNPELSQRQMYDKIPYTDYMVDIKEFNEIYDRVIDVSEYSVSPNIAIIDIAGDLAEISVRKQADVQKDIMAEQLLSGRKADTMMAVRSLKAGTEPAIFNWEPLRFPTIGRF